MKRLLRSFKMLTLAVLPALLLLAIFATAAAATTADIYEPDNSAVDAQTVVVDAGALSHTIYPAGDEDWIEFDVVAGHSYVVETSNLSSDMDTYVTVYDDAQNQVAADDNSGPGLASSAGFTAAETGTYYAQITHVDPSGTGSYDVAASTAGSISGAVTDSSDTTPLPDINVGVYHYDSLNDLWDLVASGFTDGSGLYSIGGLAAGDYRVGFFDTNTGLYTTQYYNNQPDIDSAADVSVTADTDTPGIDAAMVAGGTISGTVTDASGTALPNIDVAVYGYNAGTDSWDRIRDGFTDELGHYAVGGLATGNYRLSFIAPNGDVVEYYDDKPDLGSADEVGVTAGSETSGIDASLAIDLFPPTTVLTVDPTDPTGDNGWYKTSPLITLDRGEPGTTFYQWESTSGPWNSFFDILSLIPPDGGDHNLYYFSVDLSNNTETVQSREFKVDTEAPTNPETIISPTHSIDTTSTTRTVEIDFSPGIDGTSGVDGYSASWSKGGTEDPTETVNLWPSGDTTETTVSPSLSGGAWWFNLRTKDVAGNWSAATNVGPFLIAYGSPTGSITINSGDAFTKTVSTNLSLSATDPDSAVTQMRFKNDGAPWSGWQAYAVTKSWNLTPANGIKKAWVQFKDSVGNDSTPVSDTIFLDTVKPTSSVSAPGYSTKASTGTTFNISWAGTDPAPSSGIASYDVQYKNGAAGAWTAWKTGTALTGAVFTGKAGHTYYFKARTRDIAGNVGDWSSEARTVVPYNENSIVSTLSGFGKYDAGALFYKSTIRFSTVAGESITYGFTGNSVALISTKGEDRSRARILIDGTYVKTVDAFASETVYRKVLYTKSWSGKAAHTITIVNVGNRSRLDIDAIGVGK